MAIYTPPLRDMQFIMNEVLHVPDTLKALQDKNHVLLELDMPSGLGVLQRQGTQWVGGADPRREGLVSGD